MKSFFNLREQKEQVTVGDYTTKHFDMCPSAVKLYSKIKDITPMVHLVVENMMLHDLFFRLEKQAIAQGAIDEDDLEKAEHYAEMIMDNAEQMGLEDEHSYIEDVHLAKFEELAGMGEEDDYSEEDDYEDDMSEKTLTAAELKKREEIAKAIKRDNPNMPMAKKMAIATATAKKVAEATDDLSAAGNRRLAAIANTPNHPDRAAAKNELNRRRMQKENVEQIDELSKKTLGSYVKGASASAAGIASGIGRDIGAGKKTHKDDTRQLRNRLKGVQRATDKLTNEAAFDDESKAHDRHYAKQTPAVQNALDGLTRRGMSYKQAHAKISNPLGGHKLRKEITPLHEENLDEISAVKLGQYSAKAAQQGGDKRIAGQKMADEKIRKKYGYSSDAKVAAGSLPKKESVELDEISQATKDRYIQRSMSSHGHYAAVARDAKSRGDETTYQKARRIMKKRNQGMGRAFGQTKDTM